MLLGGYAFRIYPFATVVAVRFAWAYRPALGQAFEFAEPAAFAGLAESVGLAAFAEPVVEFGCWSVALGRIPVLA